MKALVAVVFSVPGTFSLWHFSGYNSGLVLGGVGKEEVVWGVGPKHRGCEPWAPEHEGKLADFKPEILGKWSTLTIKRHELAAKSEGFFLVPNKSELVKIQSRTK